MVIVIIFAAFVLKAYAVINPPDTQCTATHTTDSQPPKELKAAMDYYFQGNYDYDTGNCRKALESYTKSISLDPIFPQTYNNRAYTNMRMHNYKAALADLDTALSLYPNYVNALMNRGDIRNYYYQIDRKAALADYNKAISLGARDNKSACGHKAMAETNNTVPLAILKVIFGTACK